MLSWCSWAFAHNYCSLQSLSKSWDVECLLCPDGTDPGCGKTGCYRCSKPEKKLGKKVIYFLKITLFWCDSVQKTCQVSFPQLYFFFWSACCSFMGVLGVATLYCFCRKAKYLSSHHFYFKQTLILLPSAPFNREEFQIKSESFSLIATGINFLGLRLFL